MAQLLAGREMADWLSGCCWPGAGHGQESTVWLARGFDNKQIAKFQD